jgi:hypothetical protein
MRQPDEFKLPPGELPDERRITETIMRVQQVMLAEQKGSSEVRHIVPTHILKGMADIATNIWKVKAKMLHGVSGEVRDEMKRVYRHIESALETFDEMGLEVKDHTGDAFDYGLPLKVIATQPTSGITRENVIETIKPTIYWQQQIVQMGEVVIATPSTETKT